MPTTVHSARWSALLFALNRRGIQGKPAKTILRRYAQQRVALQIDYYDHEIVYRAKLPEWAAPPWLAHRIRHDLRRPNDFILASDAVSLRVRRIPYRPSRQPTAGSSPAESKRSRTVGGAR